MPITGHLPNPGTLTGVFTIQYDKPYDGEYTIVPSAYSDQVLNTRNKFLKQNIVVTEIPTYETSNDSGTTFIIGD